MRKIKSILAIVLSFLLIYFLQINFFTWFNIAEIKPNLIVVLCLLIGLFAGKKYGIIFGALIGFIIDTLIGRTLIFSSVALAIVGYLGEYFDKNFSKNSKIMIIIMSAIATLFYEISMYVVSIFKLGINIEIVSFLITLAVEILFNTLIIIIIHPLIIKWGYFVEDHVKEERFMTRYF